MGEADGLGVEFGFEVGNHFGENVLFFAADGAGEEGGDVIGMGLVGRALRICFAREDLRDVLSGDAERAGEEEYLTDDVFEFADVAGPWLALQKRDGFGLDGRGLDAEIGTVFAQEKSDEVRDIFGTFAERREFDGDDGEAVKKIFAKFIFLDGGFEIAMRGGEDAHIDTNVFVAADALEGAFLEDAEKFRLCVGMEVADFVEEDSSAVGLLEFANAAIGRAGEGAAFVTEQFAFQEIAGNGGAIHCDERFVGAIAVLINGARDEFLAGAGFAANQDRDRSARDTTDGFVNLLHRFAVADEGAGFTGGFAEADFFEHQFGIAKSFSDEIEQFVGLERLGEVFVSPELGCFDGGFGAAVRGHHDDGELGRGGVKLLD